MMSELEKIEGTITFECSVIPNQERRLYVIPIVGGKKWWQFWKTDPRKEQINKVMAQYKADIQFDDTTGELKFQHKDPDLFRDYFIPKKDERD